MQNDKQLDFFFSPEESLLKKFEDIHDFIYSNDGLSPQQALEEIIKLLFVKIHDENQNGNLFRIENNEIENIKAGEIDSIFEARIKTLFEQTRGSYADVFENDDRIRISLPALAFTVAKLQKVPLLNSTIDAKGLAFQKFLSHHEKDANGQFFTPPAVIDFCVEILTPKATEKIIDPACGSGGFLLSTLNFLRKNNSATDSQKIVEEQLFGCDINKSIARIAKMKLLLESNGKINIHCINSLDNTPSSLSKTTAFSNFDLVLANPPFGAKITNPETLRKFDMGFKWNRNDNKFQKTKTLQNAQTTEILFIEHCLNLLREGGRMGIVLPNGNFENPSLEYLRYYIKQRAKILAIINLPPETFIPFGTGVKTSILFLEKDSKNEIRNYPVFFGRITKLGYQGNKNGTPLYLKKKKKKILSDKDGTPLLDEDFSKISATYREFLSGNEIRGENTFSFNYNEINGRFDFDFYSPENRHIFSSLDKSKTVRLGDICEIVKKKSGKLKNLNQTIEYVELSDINTHAFEIINSTDYLVHELPSRASYEICEGDILTAIAGNSVGTKKHAVALVTKEFDGCVCTNGFRVLRNFTIDPYYVLYFMKTDLFLRQMFRYRTGAAIPNVSDEDLANILIYLPEKTVLDEVREKMKRSFQLRLDSKVQFENIALFRS